MANGLSAGAFIGPADPPARAPVAACFHCGLPVLDEHPREVPIQGRLRSMCCAGCEAVARTIVEAGLDGYYETRSEPQVSQPDLDTQTATEIYDDPLAQLQFVNSLGQFEREALLVLDRIRCTACVWLNEQYLRGLPGVTRVTINYTTRRAQIAWDVRNTRLGAIVAAIRGLGYDAYPFDPARQLTTERAESRAALWRLFVSGFGAMQVMMYAVPRYIDTNGTLSVESDQIMRWASLTLTVPVIVFACGPFFGSALTDLRARRLGIDVPVSIGILAGFSASVWATFSGSGEVYFDSITMLVFLLLGARYLETGARHKAAAHLDRLSRWMPAFALRLERPDDAASGARVAAHELRKDDWVLVPPGETIPADGIVMRGAGSTDESLLTGEARPVGKREGAVLTGGSINVDQPLTMRVTHAGTETRAAAIGRLIERAAAGRPKMMRSADRVAQVLTWIVLACAAAALLGWLLVEPARAFWVAIAVLMVTCPCALGLAAPIALTSATGALARRGVIATRAQSIESLTGLTDVVIDKTGTLTEGRLKVIGFDAAIDQVPGGCLALVRALEAGSRHPIAQALRDYAGAGPAARADQLVHFPGSGIEAWVDGRRVRIGSAKFVAGVADSLPPAEQGTDVATQVFVGSEAGWLGAFRLADTLRPEASGVVEGLRRQGLRIHLLSGDAHPVVAGVASRLAILNVRSEASPQEKFAYVRRLQSNGCRVAMIGDGLNDAPVLAQADLSIAMGEGATLAQLHADLVLLSGRLSGVLDALRIGGLTIKAIKQNFVWALGYNALALPLAMLGFVGPWEAAIGMTASSFMVVVNSMRLTARLGRTAR